MAIGDFIKGAIGGGLGGSSFGPLGGILGGVGGGLAGLFGGGPSREQQLYREYFDRVKDRGPAAQAGLSSFRGNQQDLIGRLEALSRGQGPSLATAQMKAAFDRGAGQQLGAAQSGRGNPAMAQFQAQNNIGRLGAQTAQDAAAARIAEQQMALQQLGLNLHGARDQDEQMGRFNTGQQNAFTGQNDQTMLGILQGMSGLAGQPTLGDQLLAGGAGMFAQGAMGRRGQGQGRPGRVPFGANFGGSPGIGQGMLPFGALAQGPGFAPTDESIPAQFPNPYSLPGVF